MADNFATNAGSGGSTFASDDISSVQHPRVKAGGGRDGVYADVATGFRLISAASTNATSLKASAGTLYSITAINLNAAVRYLKLYNKASSPTVGTDTPVATIPIPASATGAGFTVAFPLGFDFATGIAYALTTGAADADTGAVAANEIFLVGTYI
jgi:hypothetical protein